MKKNCVDCKFARKEYGQKYCMSCWNSGGKEKDEAVRAKIDMKQAAVDLRNRTVSNNLRREAEKDPKVAEIINAVCDLATD